MTATVYITQYASFGGRIKGGDDDSVGYMPQIPGRIVSVSEADAATPIQIEIAAGVSFIKVRSVGGDVHYNFDDSDSGDGSTIIANNRDRIFEGEIFFHGVVSNKTGDKIYQKINIKDV